MKVLGNRVLVSKIEEPEVEGEFKTVNVVDSFVYKGKVEQIGEVLDMGRFEYGHTSGGGTPRRRSVEEGDIIYFAKYSPDTQEVEHEGKKMKIVRIEDILAVL